MSHMTPCQLFQCDLVFEGHFLFFETFRIGVEKVDLLPDVALERHAFQRKKRA